MNNIVRKGILSKALDLAILLPVLAVIGLGAIALLGTAVCLGRDAVVILSSGCAHQSQLLVLLSFFAFGLSMPIILIFLAFVARTTIADIKYYFW